jgi:hypothetical protein
MDWLIDVHDIAVHRKVSENNDNFAMLIRILKITTIRKRMMETVAMVALEE